mgnify:CR=1 FL=1
MRLTNTNGKKLNLYLTVENLEAVELPYLFLHHRQSTLKRHQNIINKVIQNKLKDEWGITLDHIHCWEYRAEALKCEEIGQISCEREVVVFIQTDHLILFRIEGGDIGQPDVTFIETMDQVKPEDRVLAIVPRIVAEDLIHIYMNYSNQGVYLGEKIEMKAHIMRQMQAIELIDTIFKGKHPCSSGKQGAAQIKAILSLLVLKDLYTEDEVAIQWVKQLCHYERTHGSLALYDIATCYQELTGDESIEMTPQVLEILRQVDKEDFPTSYNILRWWIKGVVVQGKIEEEDFNPHEYNRLLKEQYMEEWGKIHKQIVQSVYEDDLQTFLSYCSQIGDQDILRKIMEYIDKEVFPTLTDVGVLVRGMTKLGTMVTTLTAEEEERYKKEIEEEIEHRAGDYYVISSFSKESAEHICEMLLMFSEIGSEDEIEEYLRCINYYYKYVDASLRNFSNFPMKVSELNEPFELEEPVIQLLRSFNLKGKSRFISTYLRSVATQKKKRFTKIG